MRPASILACAIAAAQAVAASAATVTGAPPAACTATDRSAPFADFHQHLLSPRLAKEESQSPPPAITVPPEVQDVLSRLERAYDSRDELRRLYAPDAAVQVSGRSTWITGGDAVATFFAEAGFSSPYRFVPVSHHAGAGLHVVAGYLARGDAADPSYFAHVVLALQRSASGEWRVANEVVSLPGPVRHDPIGADALVGLLDDAGICQAVVLSTAYAQAQGEQERSGEREAVASENDWTRDQVARHPDRLVGYCGVNPLRSYAVDEVERCAADPRMHGVKLHFGNSGVDLVHRPEQVPVLRAFFAAMQDRRLPIVIHLMSLDRGYGRDDAQRFVDTILAAAPHLPIQIAHLAGAGPGMNEGAVQALEVFARAIEAADPGMQNLTFDVASIVTDGTPADEAGRIAALLRRIGIARVVFGSDGAWSNPPPAEAWRTFRSTLPLTDDEFRTIAGHRPAAAR